ncbi:GNAT family N-acetyltransferase [Flavobacteriaceae bacterium R38]|nr:GNAT family N-acetyltransferase [Flavobacteriaceae bacterium R38]
MNSDLFISDIYTKIWLKHNNNSKPATEFDFVRNIKFVKNRNLPMVYTNVGGHLTKGVLYTLHNLQSKQCKKKVCKVIDVPSYFKLDPDHSDQLQSKSNIKVKKLKQHKGYLTKLEGNPSLDAFLKSRFNAKTRGKFRSYKKRLEYSFNITYEVYFGNISKEEYQFIYDCFYRLLKQRYQNKKEDVAILRPDKWKYFLELGFEMILNKEAFLTVIYNDGTPISISFNYCNKEFIHGYLTVFDTNYSKFSLGHISFMKIVEWGIKNKIRFYDFSKVEFEYKKRWCEVVYDFEMHIFYDSDSSISKLIKTGVAAKYGVLKYLRDKKINKKWHKLLFYLKNKRSQTLSDNYQIEDAFEDYLGSEKYIEIKFSDIECNVIKKITIDFLYKNKIRFNEVKIYLYRDRKGTYIIEGEGHKQKVILTY